MKRSRILLACLVLVTFAGAAHGMDRWLELLRADLRTDKVAILTEAMPMNTAERDLFWPLQRDYERELSAIGDRRVALLKKFAEHRKKLTDDVAEERMKEWFSVQEDRTKLRAKYYKKVAKAISPGLAARFIQIENQIGLLIDIQIAGEVPLIETVPAAEGS